MADKENITERIKKVVAEQLGISEADVNMQSSFTDDLGADSLDQVELIMCIEDEFEIEIPDEQAEKMATVQDAVNYVNSVLNT